MEKRTTLKKNSAWCRTAAIICRSSGAVSEVVPPVTIIFCAVFPFISSFALQLPLVDRTFVNAIPASPLTISSFCTGHPIACVCYRPMNLGSMAMSLSIGIGTIIPQSVRICSDAVATFLFIHDGAVPLGTISKFDRSILVNIGIKMSFKLIRCRA